MLLPVIKQIPQTKLEIIATIPLLEHHSDFVVDLEFPQGSGFLTFNLSFKFLLQLICEHFGIFV